MKPAGPAPGATKASAQRIKEKSRSTDVESFCMTNVETRCMREDVESFCMTNVESFCMTNVETSRMRYRDAPHVAPNADKGGQGSLPKKLRAFWFAGLAS